MVSIRAKKDLFRKRSLRLCGRRTSTLPTVRAFSPSPAKSPARTGQMQCLLTPVRNTPVCVQLNASDLRYNQRHANNRQINQNKTGGEG